MRKSNFDTLDWEFVAEGFKQKILKKNNKQIRLIRFEDNFSDDEWCAKPHAAFVINGTFQLEFKDECLTYTKGDVFFIAENDHHKAMIEKDQFAELILFEEIVKNEL